MGEEERESVSDAGAFSGAADAGGRMTHIPLPYDFAKIKGIRIQGPAEQETRLRGVAISEHERISLLHAEKLNETTQIRSLRDYVRMCVCSL